MHIFKIQKNKKRHYFDTASSTPRDIKMIRSFEQIPHTISGVNPHALHKEGVHLLGYLKKSQALCAEVLGAHPDEIIFTSNATESDNLAITGSISHALKIGTPKESIAVYTTGFEHSAVTEAVRSLGVASYVFDQEGGYVNPKSLRVPEGVTFLIVSVIFVQNEIGTVQPIREIAKRIRFLRKQHTGITILFHIDATQAPLFYDLSVAKLGVDLLTLGSTKLYCEKGVGLLYKKRSVALTPLFYGGGQQLGLRPGTPPVTLIYEFSQAFVYAQKYREKIFLHMQELQLYCEKKIKTLFPSFLLISNEERSPHITHVAVPDFDSELLVIELDARGFAVSSKSACHNEGQRSSAVHELLYPKTYGSLRISYGRTTTKKDIDALISALVSVVEKYSSRD